LARTISVLKWESKEEVENAVHEIKAEMDQKGGLEKDMEREMQHSLRIADPDLANHFLKLVREQVPEAMHYFEEYGGGA
jgi:membrane-bound lytic murein transglycosylase MltF